MVLPNVFEGLNQLSDAQRQLGSDRWQVLAPLRTARRWLRRYRDRKRSGWPSVS